MSLKALINLANQPSVIDTEAQQTRHRASYARVREYGKQVENRRQGGHSGAAQQNLHPVAERNPPKPIMGSAGLRLGHLIPSAPKPRVFSPTLD